jgi:hypothetical protein
VVEYSRAYPRLQEQTLATTAGSRDLSLAALAGLWTVEAVEWPAGQYPARTVEWRLSADRQTLTLLAETAPAGEPALVRWGSKHTLDAGTSTIPQEHEPVVALGAGGLACLAYSTPSADNFRYQDGDTAAAVDDSMIPVEWRRRGEAALAEFRQQLTSLARARAIDTPHRVVWSKRRPAPRFPSGTDGREP